MSVRTVRIRCKHGNVLPALSEVLARLESIQAVTWRLEDMDWLGGAEVAGTDTLDLEQQSREPGGTVISDSLFRLIAAEQRPQLIDGVATALDAAGAPILVLECVDSSFYEIRSSVHDVRRLLKDLL